MSDLSKINDYWSLRAEGFSLQTRAHLMSQDQDKWLEPIRPFLPSVEKSAETLDVGCGPGLLSVLLAKEGRKVTGLDYSEKMLERARENAHEAKVKIKLVQGDAQNPPFPHKAFDLIVTRNLTWTLTQPIRAYVAWKKILKPGGVLINLDGNHYRYLYDPDYKAERERPDFNDGHDPKYLLGVDTSIMTEIAKKLPLGQEDRPQWDVDVLVDLGATELSLSLERVNFTAQDGREISIVKNFIIAVKF
jgi:SAM-dependent methyltransferase